MGSTEGLSFNGGNPPIHPPVPLCLSCVEAHPQISVLPIDGIPLTSLLSCMGPPHIAVSQPDRSPPPLCSLPNAVPQSPGSLSLPLSHIGPPPPISVPLPNVTPPHLCPLPKRDPTPNTPQHQPTALCPTVQQHTR